MPSPSLLQRLKERKLVQWALAYLAGAWVIYEATGTALEAWDIPVLLVRSIHVLLVIGFFIVLVLAWYHGEKGRQRVSGPELLMVAALLVVAGVAVSLLPPREQGGSVGEQGSSSLASTPDSEPLLPMSPTRVAVFPPTVIGADSARQYSEWVSDALYRLLDGLGDLEGADPNALYSALYRSGFAELGTDEGRSLAAHLGAGLFVLSRLRDVGGQVSVTSTLYRTDEVLDAVQEAFAVGSWEEIGSVAEEITRDLFTAYLDEADYRLLSTAQVPNVGFEALRAYLEGEQLFRDRSVSGSRDAFDRAIAADSSFSLAWFGRAMLGGQFGHSVESIDAALRHSSGLGRRDSLLLEVARARFVDTALADKLTREFVARYPGYTWGWHVRGLHLIWFTWRWGRSMSEARGPYERLLELEPNHPFGLFFLRWVANFEERPQERDSLLALYLRGTPDTFWELYFEGERALEGAEGTRRDSVLLGMREYPGSVIAGLSLEDWKRADAALLLTDSMTRPEETRAVGFLISAQSETGRGRWQAANEHLDQLARLDPGLATALRGLLAAMPYLELPDSVLRRVRSEVEGWDGRYLLDLGISPEWGGTLRFWRFPALLGPHLKTYLLGLLAGTLEDTGELGRRAQALQDPVASTPCNHLGQDLALELRALAATIGGNPSEALALLQRAQLDVCHPTDQAIPLNMRPFGRFLRGELLAQSGREEEALGWFSGFAPVWGTEEILYQPFLYLRRAQVEETLGKQAEALDHYQKFIQAWEGADPHLQHLLNLARERARALEQEG